MMHHHFGWAKGHHNWVVPVERTRVTTPPSLEPVTTSEAKGHLRIDHNTEDAYIAALITTARRYVEGVTGRSLVTRSYTAKLDWFPATVFYLPFPPLLTVTSIKYTDDAGATSTIAAADYTVDVYQEPGRVVFDSDATWPSTTLADFNGVEIIWTAGYGATAASVPSIYVQAIYLMLAHLYENREAVTLAQGGSLVETPMALAALLNLDRASWF